MTARDSAIDAVLGSPSCLQLQQDECPAEPIDSLARTVVDTAYSEGLDYTVTVMHPERACAVTRRVWRECAKALGQQLPSERRTTALLAATKRYGTLTFDLAAAAHQLDTLCVAAQQDPGLLGDARVRFEGLLDATLQVSLEAANLLRTIKDSLELRPSPSSDDEPTPYRAHGVS